MAVQDIAEIADEDPDCDVISLSSNSTLTLLSETPNTPRVVVEDFRHRADRGYLQPEPEVGKETVMAKPEPEAAVPIVEEVKVANVEDVLEDGRPSHRLPERQSSQMSSRFSFPWCFSGSGDG